MTQQEILEKAIQKAIDNGWLKDRLENAKWRYIQALPRSYISIVSPSLRAFDETDELKLYLFEFIFLHDFAKALWPPDDDTLEGYTSEDNPMWEHHLQMMVVDPDPIAYLGANL